MGGTKQITAKITSKKNWEAYNQRLKQMPEMAVSQIEVNRSGDLEISGI